LKKIAVIGKGTAGVLAFNHFKHYSNHEITCYYSNNIKEQSVGEGSQLPLPIELNKTLGLEFHDVQKLFDSTYKKAIRYEGFGKSDYFHTFDMPNLSIHLNANKLQKFIFNKYSNNFIEKNVNSYDDIDADYIIDCRGKPSDFTEYNKAEYIPVDTALIKQCYVKEPFDYTLSKARPYGWVFAIPLQNRVSFGYLFKSSINNKDEIEKDLDDLLNELKYTTYTDAKLIKFNNYYRKINYTDRVFYNGNASFFLEPMEATSLTTVDIINRNIFDILGNQISINDANIKYNNWFKECQDIITLHYLAKPRYDTKFWQHANNLAQSCYTNLSDRAINILNNLDDDLFELDNHYGTWYKSGFKQNMKGLGIEYKKK